MFLPIRYPTLPQQDGAGSNLERWPTEDSTGAPKQVFLTPSTISFRGLDESETRCIQLTNKSALYVKFKWILDPDSPFLVAPTAGILSSRRSAQFVITMAKRSPSGGKLQASKFNLKCQISNLSISVDLSSLNLQVNIDTNRATFCSTKTEIVAPPEIIGSANQYSSAPRLNSDEPIDPGKSSTCKTT